jgi:hypothetical protein
LTDVAEEECKIPNVPVAKPQMKSFGSLLGTAMTPYAFDAEEFVVERRGE